MSVGAKVIKLRSPATQRDTQAQASPGDLLRGDDVLVERVHAADSQAQVVTADPGDVARTDHRTIEVALTQSKELGEDFMAHAHKHLRGASDPIDAIMLDVSLVPTSYTREPNGAATANEHLGAHLKGIDTKLASFPDTAAIEADLDAAESNIAALQDDLAQCQSDLSALTATVAGHTTSIAGNTSSINTLNTTVGQLSGLTGASALVTAVNANTANYGQLAGLTGSSSLVTTVTGHTSSIGTLQTTVSGHTTSIATNTSNIAANTAAIALLAPLLLPRVSYSGSITLQLSDKSNLLLMGSASAQSVTVPPNSSVAFDLGTIVHVLQYGAGALTFIAGAGVTIRSYNSSLTGAGQYASPATLIKIATNEWLLVGGLA